MTATWTDSREDGIGKKKFPTGFMEATIGASDAETLILKLDPESQTSFTVDVGASETITVFISTNREPSASNMIQIPSLSITADYEDTFVGPITAIQFKGGVTNDTVINVMQRKW